MITARVINLPRSTERLAFQQQQLAQLKIDYDVLIAVDSDSFSDETYQQASQGWQRPLTRQEVACFFSHKKAWQTVIDADTPMLILEDDALLSQKTPDILESISQTDLPYDLITLENRSRKKIIGKSGYALTPNHQLLPLYQDRTGAAGYILSVQGAKKLIQTTIHKPAALADAFISSSYQLAAYQLEPAAIIQLDQCHNYQIASPLKTQSTISLAQQPRPSSAGYKLRRLAAQLQMAYRHISVIHKSQRRMITLNKHEFKIER